MSRSSGGGGVGLRPPVMRMAAPEDLDEVVRIVRVCVAKIKGRGLDYWNDDYPSRELLAADIRRGSLFLCVDGARPCGMVVLDDIPPPDYVQVKWPRRRRPVLYLHRLAVDPGHQRRGLARHIVEFALEHARRGRYIAVRLDVSHQNQPAQGLFESMAFRRVGMITTHLGPFNAYEKTIR
jgi:ribosomal protein S18 acetylase RimI-like enzyme